MGAERQACEPVGVHLSVVCESLHVCVCVAAKFHVLTQVLAAVKHSSQAHDFLHNLLTIPQFRNVFHWDSDSVMFPTDPEDQTVFPPWWVLH